MLKNITYEQFMRWCKHWNYTEEEGYKAMCFTMNIIGQNFGNHFDYKRQVFNEGNHSDMFKKLVEKNMHDALTLLNLAGSLDNAVHKMLDDHEKEVSQMEKHCELYGCYYNQDGVCNYKNNPLQFSSERACYQEDIEAYLDSVE